MNLFLELIDLIVLCAALFLIGWYLIHRYRVNLIEPNATAISTLKALIIFLLLFFALGVVAFAFGSLVWFGLGVFFPGISDELRMNLAASASTMLCLYLLVGRPLSLLLKAGKKGDRSVG